MRKITLKRQSNTASFFEVCFDAIEIIEVEPMIFRKCPTHGMEYLKHSDPTYAATIALARTAVGSVSSENSSCYTMFGLKKYPCCSRSRIGDFLLSTNNKI